MSKRNPYGTRRHRLGRGAAPRLDERGRWLCPCGHENTTAHCERCATAGPMELHALTIRTARSEAAK